MIGKELLMKKIIFSIACVLLFSQVSFAECNIAVVDLQKVVDNSAQVKTLKNEHTAKIKELNGIVTKAQEEIAKQTDTKKIVEITAQILRNFTLFCQEEYVFMRELVNINMSVQDCHNNMLTTNIDTSNSIKTIMFGLIFFKENM